MISADTGGAVAPLGKLEAQAKKTDTAWDRAAKNIGISGNTLKTVVAGAGALLGTGLVVGIEQLVTGYADAAKAAGDLAAATGGTIEEVSGMQAALMDAGISAEQSAAMLTKFTGVLSTVKGQDILKELNVELVRGADGAVDYAATMVDVVDAIMQIENAADRSGKLIALFGKQGAKAFQDLIASGLTLSEAIALIDTGRILTKDDIARAGQFDEAMDAVAASGQKFGNTMGRLLLPAITGVINAVEPLLDLLSDIPTDVYLVAGAFAVLGLALGSDMAVAVGLTAIALYDLAAGLVATIAEVGLTTVAVGGLSAAWAAMTASMLANPLTWLFVAVAASVVALTAVNSAYRKELKATAEEMVKLTDAGMSYDQALAQVTDTTADKVASDREANDVSMEVYGSGQMVTKTLDNQEVAYNKAKQASDEAKEAAGEYATGQDEAADAVQALNDMLTEGGHSQKELSDAVNLAGAAQAEQNRITAESKGLMQAYADASWDAVNAQLAVFDATFALHDATASYNEDLAGNLKVVRDSKVGSDEYVNAMDEIAQGQLDIASNTARAAQEQDELNGVYHDSSYYQQIQIDKMKELADAPGVSPEVRDSIYKNFIDPLSAAQETATGGVLIGDIVFKSGTTEDVVKKKQAEIDAAWARGDWSVATDLQADLDGLKVPTDITEPKEVTVGLIGPDGQPLPDEVDVKVNMDTTAVTTATSEVTALESTTVNIPVDYTVTGLDAVNGYNDDLRSRQVNIPVVYTVTGLAAVGATMATLSHPRVAEVKAKPVGLAETDSALNKVAKKKRTAEIAVKLTGVAGAAAALALLDRDRWVTIHVSTSGVEAAREALVGLEQTSSVGSMLTASQLSTSTGGGLPAGAGVREHLAPSPRPKVPDVHVYVDGREIRATADASRYRTGRP